MITGQMEITKLIPIENLTRAANEEKDISVVLGTFPTTTGMHSIYRLSLYRNTTWDGANSRRETDIN